MTATAVAQTSTMPSSTPLTQSLGVEDIWKNPQIAGPTLSRSGKYLAATAPNRGRMNLLVLDMETRKSDLLTSFDDFDVINVSWLGDDRLMFSLGQNNSPTGPGQFDSGGLFVVNRDGTNFRRLGASGAGGGRERRVHAGHFIARMWTQHGLKSPATRATKEPYLRRSPSSRTTKPCKWRPTKIATRWRSTVTTRTKKARRNDRLASALRHGRGLAGRISPRCDRQPV